MDSYEHADFTIDSRLLTWDDLMAMLNYSNDAIILYDSAFRFRYINVEAERLLGQPAAQLIGKDVWATFPNSVSSFQDRFVRAIAGQTPLTFEVENPHSHRRTEGRCVPIQRGGQPGEMALAVFFRDITQQRRAEEDLRVSEEQLRLAVEGAEIGTWHWDIPKNALSWSKTTSALLGLPSVETPTYEMFMNAIHPDDRDTTHQAVGAALENKAPYDVEYRAIWPDGSVHWHISRGRCYYDDQETPYRMEGILIDITDRKRTEQELRVRAERESLLNQIEQAIRTTVDPNQIQQTAVRELGHALQVDRCYFSLFDIAADSSWIGDDFRKEGLPSLAGHYPISHFQINPGDYYPDGQTLIIEDVTTWSFPEPLVTAIQQLRVRSAFSVPFFDNGQLVATLGVAMADEPRVWTATEVALAEAVAVQTRSAIADAHVRQRERTIATQLQDALQPPLPEGVSGLRLAKYYDAALQEAGVGGDFYDVFALEKGCTVLTVGDLSGKGLAAASQVATVRNMLRAFLYSKPTAAEAVNDLNQVLALNNLLSGFATLFVGCYDSATQELSYVNCGQEPALLRRHASGEIERLEPTGPVLGSFENAVFEEQVVALRPGDALAIFTDGMTECGPSRLELLGIEGVSALLTHQFEEMANQENQADAIAQALITGMPIAGGAARDDVCLLVAVASGQ